MSYRRTDATFHSKTSMDQTWHCSLVHLGTTVKSHSNPGHWDLKQRSWANGALVQLCPPINLHNQEIAELFLINKSYNC